jgi:hypothetical protein
MNGQFASALDVQVAGFLGNLEGMAAFMLWLRACLQAQLFVVPREPSSWKSRDAA